MYVWGQLVGLGYVASGFREWGLGLGVCVSVWVRVSVRVEVRFSAPVLSGGVWQLH